MASIKQNLAGQPLPDFRNAGVMLRILLGVNLLAVVAALVQSDRLGDSVQHYIRMAAWVQPLLFFNLALLALLGKLLQRPVVWIGRTAVVLLAAGSAVLLSDLSRALTLDEADWQRLMRAGLLGGITAAFMLSYLAMRVSALSPALAEARLQWLTARIRPHFLFNSALMRDPRELVPLADEIALCRQYLDLEKLRLGDRLNVQWEMVDLPLDLKVPPLLLQPLLENAVYHGIEPAEDSGTIRICLMRRGDALYMDLANPCSISADQQRGNHMALDNLRERLALCYDLEARLDTGEVLLADGRREYRVQIVLPCRRQWP